MAARILVIDSNESDRTDLAARLHAVGLGAVAFRTVPPALAYLAHTKTDVVLADMLGADIAPAELIRRLRSRWPALPLVALGRPTPENRGRFSALMSYLGADAVLEKPAETAALLKIINRFAAR